MIPITEIHPLLAHFPIVLWMCTACFGGQRVCHPGVNAAGA
jgi:heterodisulfide reductase subunit C